MSGCLNMKTSECPHRPSCPPGTTRFVCGKRTLTEDAVKRGLITRQAGESLLKKYGCPMTPASKVYHGDPVTPEQGRLHVEAASDHVDRVDTFLRHRKF